MADGRELHAEHEADAESDARTLYLRDGRRVVVRERGGDQLLELTSESGLVELRVLVTESGPVLQFEGARMMLRATEAIALDAKHIAIRGSETVEIEGGTVRSEAHGENHMVGHPIHLNRDVE
jgi:hypothetical protein